MNTSSEPRRCPVCSAEIPAGAPQGLCPKCLLLGVASVAELSANSGGLPARGASPAGEPRAGRAARAIHDTRSAPPSVEELTVAFPQLEIVELIGRGGMGFVYKARQPKLDRLVALKILPGHLADEPSFHERFEREARVLAKLQHPLIVSVYDFGEAVTPDSRYFYLMLEFVDGVNLREAMRAGRFTPDQALAIVPQVCEALQYAHSKGVLHRDIKPENILLDTDGRVKIADFGIAKVLGPELDAASSLYSAGWASESEMAVTRLTATGSVLGTPLYMAPEQLISPNSVDHRADIFSLGVVFYEMLTGELPMGRFAPPSEKSLADRRIDQRVDEIVMRALAKEKELRQQSAGEMKTEVELVASNPRFVATGSSVEPKVRPVDDQGSKLTGRLQPPPVPPESAVPRGNTSGRGGWIALASLMIGTPFALSPFVALPAVQIDPANPPSPPSPTWMAFMFLLMILFIFGGLFTPIVLGWRHLIRQHRDYSRNGIIPAMIAVWFVPLYIADIGIYFGFRHLFPHISPPPPEFHALCVAVSAAAMDGVILYATWCWVTHTPMAVPPALKSRLFWRPVMAVVGWTLVTIPVGWLAVEAVQAYGRYEFTRFDTSTEHLVPKSGDYEIAPTVWCHTKTQGNRSEPFPSEAHWEMIFYLKNAPPFVSSTVEVNLATLTLSPHHERIPLNEETLLARMKSAGIDTNRLDVQAEARSLIATAEKLREQLAQQIPLSLRSQIDEKYWNVKSRSRDTRTTFHGWNVTYQAPYYSLDVRVNEADAFLAMSGIFAFWLTGLLLLLRNPRVTAANPLAAVSDRREESPWPRRFFWLAASVVAVIPVTIVLGLVTYQLSGTSPQPLPQPSRAYVKSANSSPTNSRKQESAAEIEARKLGLLRVAEEKSRVSLAEGPIGLFDGASGIASDLVEPHFSSLVHLRRSMKDPTYCIKPNDVGRRFFQFHTNYPIDSIACDWTSGEDNPLIIGYMLPPGAYDFRADAETDKLLNTVDSSVRAKFASDALKLVADSADARPITESDWQQATRRAYVRFKLIPRSLSKLNVPEECLVVLTEGSRAVFTREGGRFTEHVLNSEAAIRKLRDSIGIVILESEVKALLGKAHRAMKQQNWEELLTCLTDDGRDEWMLEITQGCSLALAMMKNQGSAEILSNALVMGTLTQLFEELRKLAVDPTIEQGNLLRARFENYSKLSAGDRRQLRIDIMRTRYPDMARVATTTLTFVRELDPKQMIIDFSQVNDLHIEENRATGTWSTSAGAHNPIVLRQVDSSGQLVWKIDSLVGKSVLDPPYQVFASPAVIERADRMASDASQRETQPADATAPENVREDIEVKKR